MTFGFIITRHVNSPKTNKYWNQSVKLIRLLYPFKQIIIIDDNSKQEFIKADFQYKNIQIIQSEYPGTGELLPYIYFLKNPQWFDNAVILHDSVFIHKRISFEKLSQPVIPLWHFQYDKENLHNLLRICSGLKNNFILMEYLSKTNTNILGLNNENEFVCCFGVQSYINHQFLSNLEKKYGFTNLVHYVKNRTDRCGMERIMGLLFTLEYPILKNYKSLLGNIQTVGNWGYKFEDYEKHFRYQKINRPIVKVWTGR